MNFGQALDSALIKNYKTFKGRACRAEWFYFLLFSVGLTILISIIGGIVSVAGLDVEYLATLSEEQAAEYLLESPQFEYIKWVSIVVGLLLFLPSLSVTVRRLQDLDYSFYWAIPYFVTSALALIISIDPLAELAQRLGGAVNLVSIVYILVFLRKGSYGPNRFGENPLEENPKDTY
jgi:uncharacterized membrane protein YhaH (DUF805 family)